MYEEEEMRVQVYPLRDDLTTGTRPILLVLSGGVLFLMLLVSANLATLMLVRGRTRSGEDAIRATVGCGWGRLFRGKLTECLLLVVAGSALGTALAWAAIRVVRALAPPTIPLIDQVSLNGPVLLLTLGAAFLLILVSGSVSALQLGRLSLVGILKSDAPGGSGEGRQRMMNTLVVGELALSMMLLAGAAVMLRTLQEMNQADLGFDVERVLTFNLLIYPEEFRSQETRRVLMGEIKEGIEALPGVEGLARSSMPPLSGAIWNRIYGWDQESLERNTERADLTISSADYFQVMGTRLLAGRFFTQAEMTDSSNSIIVDEKLANIAWPGEDPIGKRVLLGDRAPEGVVVGVVEHMLMRDFGLESYEAIHYPEGDFWPPASFVVRTGLEPETLTPSIRRVLRSIHPTLVPFKIMSLSDRVALSMASTRFVTFLMTSFAGISFLVAVTGLFGVIAYAVRTRTAELGIRMAVGADRASILRLVLGKGALLTGIGILGGLVGALALGRFIESVVFGVSPTDPLILGGAALVLGGVSILACCAPARWASRLPPARVLRTE
jgi:putative ABC transport system permease protein